MNGSIPAMRNRSIVRFHLIKSHRMATKLKAKFPRLLPQAVRRGVRTADLIETAFKAYNGGRLAEACRLYANKMLAADGTVGVSITGALTPAGLGKSCLIPLIEAGFVDWIVSTG